jgi:hypothetical protein
MGLLCLLMGAAGKLPKMKRPALMDIPPAANRVIYVWVGLVMTVFGVFLMIEAHRR